jgi:hypothetical protein
MLSRPGARTAKTVRFPTENRAGRGGPLTVSSLLGKADRGDLLLGSAMFLLGASHLVSKHSPLPLSRSLSPSPSRSRPLSLSRFALCLGFSLSLSLSLSRFLPLALALSGANTLLGASRFVSELLFVPPGAFFDSRATLRRGAKRRAELRSVTEALVVS